MTVENTDRTAGPFIGTGSLVTYPFTFKVFVVSDVVPTVLDADGNTVTWANPADYSITLNADQDASPGGILTPTVALPTNYTLTLTSDVAAIQDLEITAEGFYPPTMNDALDRLTIICQQLLNSTALSLLFPISELGTFDQTLPVAATRAGKFLIFDDEGNPIASPSLYTDFTTTAGSIGNINIVAADIDNINTVAADITTVSTVATAIAAVNTVATDIAAVNTVAANISAITTNNANATSINTVASNITNVNTVAGISAAVSTVAGISANITAVAGDLTNINICATNISAINAAPTAATNAANSATAAAASALAAQSAVVGLANQWAFDSSTVMAAPGTGGFRLNNATPGAVTAIAFSALSNDSGNPNLRSYINSWDDSTHTPRGTLRIAKDSTHFAIFGVNDAVTDNTSWLQVPVTLIASVGTFTAADITDVSFVPSGNDGMGVGSVTSVSVTAANGISGTVATATTTPAITLVLGNITPSSVNSVVVSGSATPTLAVTGTSAISGSNTGDQTITLTGNVTGSGTGSFATTIAASSVTNAMHANMAANTVKANATAAAAAPTDVALAANTFLGVGATGNLTACTVNSTLAFTAAALGIASNAALPGSPTTTTQAVHDNSTKLATTAYADRVIAWDFVSAPTGFISGGTVTFAHGLGVVPSEYSVYMQCTTASGVAAVGDIFRVDYGVNTFNGAANLTAFSYIKADATNITVAVAGNLPQLAGTVITATNFRLITKARK